MERFLTFVHWGGGYAIAASFFLVAALFRRRLAWCVLGWLIIIAQALFTLQERFIIGLTHHYTPPDVTFIFSAPSGIVLTAGLAAGWSYFLLRRPKHGNRPVPVSHEP
jgi:hypothetical protein